MLIESDEMATTAAPGPGEYLDIIKESVMQGYRQIIAINISSNISASHQSALVAKQIFYEENPESAIDIHVVDSFSVGHGSGWLILKVVELVEKGYEIEEVLKFCNDYKAKIRHLLCVNDLDAMVKSGRLSNVNAFIAKLFSIKPLLTMVQGEGKLIGKKRGINRVLDFYINELKTQIDKENSTFIIISYTSDIKIANDLASRIKKETSFDGKLYIMQMGAAIGVYVGLGSLAMYYCAREVVE